MKRCTKCGEWKPRADFYAAKGCIDGLRGDCKACFAARRRVWYSKNREREIARVKAWQQANPERHGATQKRVRDRRRPVARDQYLRRTFGLGSAEYDELLRAQGGRCRICRRQPRVDSSLHVDHDHETGEVRGLLCFRCNGGLGQFAEDAERLRLAADYLEGDLEQSSTRELLRVMTVARARLLVRASG
jgi:hypothetical protein